MFIRILALKLSNNSLINQIHELNSIIPRMNEAYTVSFSAIRSFLEISGLIYFGIIGPLLFTKSDNKIHNKMRSSRKVLLRFAIVRKIYVTKVAGSMQ